MADPLIVERRVSVAPAEVYRYLTEADGWRRWQGVAAQVEARPGGLFMMTMANGMRARGQFVELDRHRRVVFSWGWVDHPGLPPGSTTVEIDLIPDGEGTLIRLTHTGLSPEDLALHQVGWVHYLGRLAAVATGGDPGPDPGPPAED